MIKWKQKYLGYGYIRMYKNVQTIAFWILSLLNSFELKTQKRPGAMYLGSVEYTST